MIEEKLQNGDSLLEKAEGDKQLHGVALLAYHGALEDFFRLELSSEIADFEKRANVRRVGWVDLVNLWEEKYGLTSSDRSTILSKNLIRQGVGHGSYIEIERAEAERYGRFVKRFITNYASHRTHTPVLPPVQPVHVTSIPKVHPASSSKTVTTRSTFSTKWVMLGILLILFGTLVLMNRLTDGLVVERIGNNEIINSILDSGRVEPAFEGTVAPPASEEEPTLPAPSLPNSTREVNTIRIQIQGSSNVRAGPGMDFTEIGIAPDGSEYDVLETTPDKSWYKIRLVSGEEGWIGSRRVTEIAP